MSDRFLERYGVPRDAVERVAHVLGDMTPGLPFGEAIGQRHAEILRVALAVTRAVLDVEVVEGE